MLIIREITETNTWDAFVKKQEYTLFTQSSHYGNFYKTLGEESFILGIFDNEALIGGCLVVSVHAKRGKFLFIPYGPFLPENNRDSSFKILIDKIKDIAIQKKYDFIRVSPFMDDNDTNHALFANFGFRQSPIHILAENTWLLDITQSEETILSAMNKNHRNLIRRCLNAGVKIEKTGKSDSIKEFHAVLDETTKRHKFHRFSTNYINAEFEAFSKDNEAILYFGYLPDKRLDASAIVMSYGSMACYRHGASYGLDKHLPVSYALQWNAIIQAKLEGKKWYNFWGVAPEGSNKKHPFFGITHFKKGFGGAQKNLLPCHDLPISIKYYFNWSIETIRRIKRGF